MRAVKEVLAAWGFFLGVAAVVITPSYLLARNGVSGAHTFDREAACRNATATFYRVQDAPFKSWVGYEYGEANGPRVNGEVFCDDPRRPVVVKVY